MIKRDQVSDSVTLLQFDHGRVTELVDRAISKAGALARIPAATFVHTKRSLRDRYWAEVETTGRQRDAEMLEVWRSPATMAAISDYVQKTLGK